MDWYEERVEGLGAQFLDRVAEALDHVSMYPESCPILLGRVRRKVMRQFPYSIIYSLPPDEIFVLAIAHQKRRIDYWKDRL
jgi:plasmid stabilization system protein ParE